MTVVELMWTMQWPKMFIGRKGSNCFHPFSVRTSAVDNPSLFKPKPETPKNTNHRIKPLHKVGPCAIYQQLGLELRPWTFYIQLFKSCASQYNIDNSRITKKWYFVRLHYLFTCLLVKKQSNCNWQNGNISCWDLFPRLVTLYYKSQPVWSFLIPWSCLVSATTNLPCLTKILLYCIQWFYLLRHKDFLDNLGRMGVWEAAAFSRYSFVGEFDLLKCY